MRGILTLTLKDVRRQIAEPWSILVSLSIPLVIAGMMALAFGRQTGGVEALRLHALLLDEDDSPLTRVLAGGSQNREAAERLQLTLVTSRGEGMRRMREEKIAAMLVLPKGFAADLLNGRRTQVELIKNPSLRVMPVVAQQLADAGALLLTIGSRLAGDFGPQLQQLMEGEGWENAAGVALLIATARSRIEASESLLFPPLIELKEVAGAEEEGAGGFDLIGWMYPGMVVMGLLFTGINQMKDLPREGARGTLRRQLASPVGAGAVLAAKLLATAVVVAAAQIILIGIGTLAFGLQWRSLSSLAWASLLLVGGVLGFCAILFSIARTERQGDAFGGVVVMLMSMMGGAFIPVQAMPDWLKSFAPFTFNYWGNEALRAAAAGGAGQTGLASAALALTAFALVGILAGMTLMRVRHVTGAV